MRFIGASRANRLPDLFIRPRTPYKLAIRPFNSSFGSELSMPEADNDNSGIADPVSGAGAPRKPLSPAAQRALAEAEERRRAQANAELPPEIGGRGGAEPSRFGDWEINGRAIDF
jgi:hypothetical protein